MLKHREEGYQQRPILLLKAAQANLVLCMLIYFKNEIGKSMEIKCSADFKCQSAPAFLCLNSKKLTFNECLGSSQRLVAQECLVASVVFRVLTNRAGHAMPTFTQGD